MLAVTRATQEEHPRNGQSRSTSVDRKLEEYITQVSKEIEGGVTNEPSQDFSRTKSRILGALSKLDEFLLNPRIRTRNQEPNEDRSQDNRHPEVGPSLHQSRHSIDSDPDEAPDRLHETFASIQFREP